MDIAILDRVPIDPDLILIALELAYERPCPRAAEHDALTLATEAFAEYAELDDDDLAEDDDMTAVVVVGALACRRAALAEAVETNRIEPGTYLPEAIAEAACEARLISVRGAPAFLALDFIARVERAAEAL